MRRTWPVGRLIVTTLVFVGLVGCGDDDDPVTPPVPTGSLTVAPAPFTLDAAWRLTGPQGRERDGTGWRRLDSVEPGEYVVTWLGVDGRQTPPPSTVVVGADSAATVGCHYVGVEGQDLTTLVIDGRGVANHPGQSVVYRVDLRGGAADSVAVIDHPYSIGAMVRGPDDALWGVATVPQQLVRLDPETYAVSVIGVLGDWSHQRVVSLAVSPAGVLYGFDERRGGLVVIDHTDATASPLAEGVIEWGAAIAFGPDGTLYAASYWPELLVILDPRTGAVVDQAGSLNVINDREPLLVSAMRFSPDGVLYGLSGGSGIAVAPGSIDEHAVEIDHRNGRVWVIGGFGGLGGQGCRTPRAMVF
jgi:hypothetical protein